MHFGLRASASAWIDLRISNRCGRTHAPTIIYSLTARTPELTLPVRIPARPAHAANPLVLAAGAPSLRLELPADRGAPQLQDFLVVILPALRTSFHLKDSHPLFA